MMKGRIIFFSLAAVLLSQPLFADQIRIKGLAWPGVYSNESEERFFADDLLLGNSLGRIDMGWSGGVSMTTPVSAEYAKSLNKKAAITAGVTYSRHTPDYSFIGFSFGPSVSMVSLDNFYENYLDGEIGLKFAIDSMFTVHPKVGLRNIRKGFDVNDLTLFNGGIIFTLDGPFRASVNDSYAGGDLRIKLKKNFTLVGGYYQSVPIMGDVTGDMEYELLRAGGTANNIILFWDQASAGYQFSMTKFNAGVEFNLSENVVLHGGYMHERTEQRYPGYLNIPIMISGSSILVNDMFMEYVTDYIFWSAAETSQKGMLYAGVSVDFDI